MKALIKAIGERLNGKVPLTSMRSKQWPTVRGHFEKANPECAACAAKEGLQIHHIKPFHMDPTKELDYTNLITLCEGGATSKNCHLKIGHLDNFKNENPDVVEMAAALRKSLNLPEYVTVIPQPKQ